MRYGLVVMVSSVALAAGVSCSTNPPAPVATGSGGQGGAGGGGGGVTSTSTGGGGGGATTTTSSTSGGCVNDPGIDDDGDGFSEDEGDCNDCDVNTGPNAVEVATPDGEDPADEDCDGEVDEVEACDEGLMPGSLDAKDAVKAVDICKVSSGDPKSWGLVEAKWTRADGATAMPGLNVGLLAKLGANITPRGGKTMLVLSSGRARDAADMDACGSQSCTEVGSGTPPPSFPQDVPGCMGGTAINDDVALEVTLNAPKNGKGISFDFAFTSFEHPEYVCTTYNDQFIALVDPPPPGSINGNVSFDSQKNPVSVNIALFDHCDPALKNKFAQSCTGNCPSPPDPYCPNGTAFMDGTGFDVWGDAGSTGWLTTTAPVGSEAQVKIRFAIWDTGDTAFDSTVIVDHFTWSADPGTAVGTKPVDE